MNHDEEWFLRKMDSHSDLLGRAWEEDREPDEWDWQDYFQVNLMEECDEPFRDVCGRNSAGPWTTTSVAPVDVKIRHGRPQLRRRQIHPNRWGCLHRWFRHDYTSALLERSSIRRRIGDRDMDDQLDDYYAGQLTDIPSVGMTTFTSYFVRNLGEYSLVENERCDYTDDFDLEEDQPVFDGERLGLNSEDEYEDYLDVSSSLYADDWHDPSYYDDLVLRETP